MSKVSVVLAAYRGEKYIADQLWRLFAQTYPRMKSLSVMTLLTTRLKLLFGECCIGLRHIAVLTIAAMGCSLEWIAILRRL